MDNTPIYGCSGCSTTGGRMSCYQHGQSLYRIIPTISVPISENWEEWQKENYGIARKQSHSIEEMQKKLKEMGRRKNEKIFF